MNNSDDELGDIPHNDKVDLLGRKDKKHKVRESLYILANFLAIVRGFNV